MDRAFASGAKGREFESLRAHKCPVLTLSGRGFLLFWGSVRRCGRCDDPAVPVDESGGRQWLAVGKAVDVGHDGVRERGPVFLAEVAFTDLYHAPERPAAFVGVVLPVAQLATGEPRLPFIVIAHRFDAPSGPQAVVFVELPSLVHVAPPAQRAIGEVGLATMY